MTDPCATCPHPWHGLPCRHTVRINPSNPYQVRPCTCLGPFASDERTKA